MKCAYELLCNFYPPSLPLPFLIRERLEEECPQGKLFLTRVEEDHHLFLPKTGLSTTELSEFDWHFPYSLWSYFTRIINRESWTTLDIEKIPRH